MQKKSIFFQFQKMIYEILTKFHHKMIKYIRNQFFSISNDDFWNPHLISSENDRIHKKSIFSISKDDFWNPH